MKFIWCRSANHGYECSSMGDRRFSSLYARLRDGRTIDEAYQAILKTRAGDTTSDLMWDGYLSLWEQWARENPEAIEDLRARVTARGGVLTDNFASGRINQASALVSILNDGVRDLRKRT